MSTAIAVLCYNKFTLSERCIQSILDAGYPLHQVSVIDNGSLPEFTLKLKEALPDISVISLSENSGFAGGFKYGLSQFFAARPESDSVMFLTNDTRVHSGIIEACKKTAQQTQAGLVAPCLLFRQETDRIDSIGARFDPDQGTLHHCNSSALPPLLDAMEYIPGTALWITRNAFEQLAGTDPTYVMYWEDVDLSFRAHQLGIRQARCYEARISHGVGQTCHKKPIYTTYYYQRNRIRFCRKWLTPEQWERVQTIIHADLQQLRQKAVEKSDTIRLNYLCQLFEELTSTN